MLKLGFVESHPQQPTWTTRVALNTCIAAKSCQWELVEESGPYLLWPDNTTRSDDTHECNSFIRRETILPYKIRCSQERVNREQAEVYKM